MYKTYTSVDLSLGALNLELFQQNLDYEVLGIKYRKFGEVLPAKEDTEFLL